MPSSSCCTAYWPFSLVVRVLVAPVTVLRMVTLAPATTAPDWSLTVPSTSPVNAPKTGDTAQIRTKKMVNILCFTMCILLLNRDCRFLVWPNFLWLAYLRGEVLSSGKQLWYQKLPPLMSLKNGRNGDR